MKEINVISLFDGHSGAQMAFREANVKVGKYYASEIDKHAIQMTQHLFPGTIQLGDITNWRNWDIDWSQINIITAGSPCQGFSFAGKQLAFDDDRSKLFFVFIEILNHCKKHNPDVYFFLENVNMKKEHMKVINDYLGIYGQNINSNLVSAQNRNRWYWTNISTRKNGLFGELETYIEPPKDKGIFLKDILQPECEIDEKYYIKSDSLKGLSISDKAPTQRASTGRCLDDKHNYQIIKLDKKLNLKQSQNKASCLTGGGHSGGNRSDMDIICVAMRGRNPDNPSDRRTGCPTKQRLEPQMQWKTNCITSVQKDNLLTNGYWLRRLTPTECGRSQTIPDDLLEKMINSGISDTQLYKMFGNGWTISIPAEYFKCLNK